MNFRITYLHNILYIKKERKGKKKKKEINGDKNGVLCKNSPTMGLKINELHVCNMLTSKVHPNSLNISGLPAQGLQFSLHHSMHH